MTKQVHLAAHFPGVNNTTVWSDPAAGSHIESSSFTHFAQTAERGLFDFLFLAESKNLSTRELIIEVTGRQAFVGSARTVANEINRFVQHDASDGFILVPHLTPGGLDRFVDEVIPELQDLGVYRTAYPGGTLRHNLGLADVVAG